MSNDKRTDWEIEMAVARVNTAAAFLNEAREYVRNEIADNATMINQYATRPRDKAIAWAYAEVAASMEAPAWWEIASRLIPPAKAKGAKVRSILIAEVTGNGKDAQIFSRVKWALDKVKGEHGASCVFELKALGDQQYFLMADVASDSTPEETFAKCFAFVGRMWQEEEEKLKVQKT